MWLAAAGDVGAFEQIVRLMTPKLKKVVSYYAGQSQDADDILQEIWMKLWRRAHVLANKENPEYWLFTVVRHHCYDAGRKQTRQKSRMQLMYADDESTSQYIDMVHGAAADYLDPEALTIRKETAEFIRGRIDGLKELYSLPIYLYYFNDLSISEIASLLGISASAVKWRLHTGRQLLKKELKKHDY
ncbi:MAG: RNA polymerase sigma factor [Defluviitaleaceae bacterium]|nr:RNA polymerase sigma factor [Defluviitaleaceae bacterium]